MICVISRHVDCFIRLDTKLADKQIAQRIPGLGPAARKSLAQRYDCLRVTAILHILKGSLQRTR